MTATDTAVVPRTGRGARRKFDLRTADHQPSDVDRMKPVDVLVRVDGIEHLLFIDVLGQRQLDQNTVDLILVVLLFDQVQQVFF